MNKIRALAQVVGFVTLGLLALYGLLVLSGVAGPIGLAAEADAEMPNAAGEAAAVLGGTIPQTMNYQGFLRDPDGSLTTGAYTITARIYELAAPSPGETVFYETTLPNVTVRDGLFNIVLGDDPELPPDAFSDAPRYIGIDLNDGGGELIPRQRLHAVPWALTATTLVDDAPAQSVQGLSSSGNITLTNGSDIIVEGGGMISSTLDAGALTIDGEKPFFIQKFYLGKSRELSTQIPIEDYVCGIAGFQCEEGDIQEDGTGDIIYVYLAETPEDEIPDDYWWIYSDLWSHNVSEKWSVWVMCVDSDMAEYVGGE